MAKAKKKVTDRDIYAEWYVSNGAPAAIAKKMGTTQKRVTDAIHEGLTEFAQNSKGELSIADPLNLYGGRFSVTPYNPDTLVTRKGLGIFDLMREDDQVKAATLFKRHTVLSAGYEVVSPEDMPEDWEVTEFIKEQLDNLEGSFQTSLIQIMTSLDYGYSITEKIFEERDGLINLTALKTRKPHPFSFDVDEFGNIKDNGLWQANGKDAQGGYAKLPPDKFVIYTHQFEFGNHYGKSDLVPAYRAWWSKDNAYKFLMMVLERYGVPTILALYDPKKYSAAHVNALYTALKSMSSTTMGVIPRSDPDNLELWSPDGQHARAAKDVFVPVTDMFNRDIARAVLMPGLLGLTPDQAAGSFARARVQFDVFMLVVEFLRSEIQEKVMMDQIIKPLVNLNFTTDVYPEFRFLPLTDDIRLDILQEWREQVSSGAVKSRPADENRVRDLLDFELLDDDEMEEREEPDEEENEIGDPDEEEIDEATKEAVESFAIHSDFATIEKELDRIEARSQDRISAALIVSRDSLLKHVEKNFKHQSEFANSIKHLRKIKDVNEAVEEFLLSTYQMGRTTLRREVKAFTNNEVKWYDDPNFKPADAMRHLQQKSLWVTGVMEDDLVEEARLILLKAVESGTPLRATMASLGAAFDPYVGITVDGVVVTPHRLATIIRTNATDAFNTGRLVQARQAGALLQGFEYSSILDARTTEVCRFLDGKKFKPGDGTADQLRPPRHFNCRSYLIPIPASANAPSYITASQVARGLQLSHQGF